MALVVSSSTPLILLNQQLVVQAASGSFCRNFSVDCESAVGKELFELGVGEWEIPQLRSLLTATAAGHASIDAYEMDLKRDGVSARHLVIHAHMLDHHGEEALRLVVAVTDVTEIRQAQRANDALLQEKQVLLQELNHRVANSLQIIASVLMQRVRISQSEETRIHLRDAHHRVMSIATLQRQLASSSTGDVELRRYFTDLCASIGASMIADPQLLSLTVDADDSITTAEKSVSMGLIVTELVINSLKHAYPATAKGMIKIGFHATAEGWILTVADDGIGIQGDHASGKPGLGTGIVNALAGQLSATVEVTDADPGCLVSIIHR
ncbi:histidine kinase dimerization/phosphoacceptor domain -containing protein [Sphingomonas sp. LY54]|uniref:sensor histidine kinase n=1 Tax=Sphingomonas sp. LY54 TaxID=3095343 RepID=UPI002D7A27DC|nr:histidine kinase dimerization/phosphoacceptor domain -containing protein [Sphingomonas sp. LY54]WRP27554.1 histidine kinase dimerization/phosphoacceptor domain -containing protein [Sphingomonas sp. LY54]